MARVLDRYFEALRKQDWDALSACLARDVHRVGPYLDAIDGSQAYVEFLAGIIPTLPNYDLRVHGTHVLENGAILVLLSEVLDRKGRRTEFPEALVFGLNDEGLIQSVDIYIKQPPDAASD